MSSSQVKVVAKYLEVLEGQKQEMFSLVDRHLAKVFQVSQDWMDNKQEHRMSFSEVRAYIDDAFELIVDKCEGFNVGDETEEASGFSQSRSPDAVSQPDHSSPQLGAKVFKPFGDEDTVKKILARINNIEETVSSLQTATSIVTDKQKLVEKLVQQRSEKMSNFEEEQANRMTSVEKQVKKLSEKQKKKGDQLNTKIGKIETNIIQLSSSVSEIKQHNYECLEKIENQMDLDRASASDHEQYCKTTFEKTDKAVEDLRTRVEVVETSMNNLTTKTESNTSSLSDMKVSKNKICRKLKYLEDGLKNEETRRRKVTDSLEKKIGETERATEMGNRIMGERLRDVEEVKNLLNSFALQKGANNVAKLHKLADEFDVMASKLKQVETVCTKKCIGFSAVVDCGGEVNSKSVVKEFGVVLSNPGGHYDSTTGVFTAPLDGVYVTFASIMQFGGSYIEASVRHSQGGNAVDGTGKEFFKVEDLWK